MIGSVLHGFLWCCGGILGVKTDVKTTVLVKVCQYLILSFVQLVLLVSTVGDNAAEAYKRLSRRCHIER